MKKLKINIKPIILHVNKVKKKFIKNDHIFFDLYKEFNKMKIFDNLLAMICYFWINKNKNILTTSINNSQIKKAPCDENNELINVFKEIIYFASKKIADISLDNKEIEYFNFEKLYNEFSKKNARKLTEIFSTHSINLKEELLAIEQCLESLINFNFIDLHTNELKILKKEEKLSKYDNLILLVEKQIDYLSNSYSSFKNANSPNFNFIFKTILTLRKCIY
ncbi:hypothetical protein [Mycoplasmoides alvi]|uniref:hypothetical protein n=1 Tax=Mycoplasmoides alvi TaxID=78580 RepID=UPI00051B228D|nr:hypothetical protein [Mycoplasmoides alvi]